MIKGITQDIGNFWKCFGSFFFFFFCMHGSNTHTFLDVAVTFDSYKNKLISQCL